MANTATILSDGGSLFLSLDPATSSWGGALVASVNPTYFPIVSIGISGNINTLHQDVISIAPVINASKVEFTVNLAGYAYSDEPATVSIGSGLIRDAGNITNSVITNLAVTNNSIKTSGTAYTRFKGLPVVNWAIRDKYPISGTTARIACDAHDSWAGVDWVEYGFNSGGINVITDSAVTNTSGNFFRVSQKRVCDLYGYGFSGDYWYMDIALSGANDGDYRLVNISQVRTKDGIDHNPSIGVGSGFPISPKWITKRNSPVIKYLDTTATGANNGSSWTDAYNNIVTCEAGVGTGTDIVLIAPGLYNVIGFEFDQSRTNRFLVWQGDTSQVGNGSGDIRIYSSGTFNFRSYQAFKNVKFYPCTASGTMRGVANYISFENVYCEYPDKTVTAPASYNGTNISWVRYIHKGGWRTSCGSTSRVSNTLGYDSLNHGSEQYECGTALGTTPNGLTEFFYAHHNAISGFPTNPPTHFDYLHAFDETSVSNLTWTESTKVMSGTGSPFVGLTFTIENELQQFHLSDWSNLSGAYKITQKINNDAIVLETSPYGFNSGGIAGKYICGHSNFTIRYSRILDNGFKTTVAGNSGNYNFGLFEIPLRNCAIYGNVLFSACSQQQIFQFSANSKNLQIVHNTFLQTDNDAVGLDARGLSMTGNKCFDPYPMIGYMARNNILHSMSASNGGSVPGHPQGQPTNVIRKRLYGPNIVTTQSADGVNSTIVKDNTIKTSTSGLASLALNNTLLFPYDLRPSSNSIAVSGTFQYAQTDFRFDMFGNPFSGDAGALSTYSFLSVSGGTFSQMYISTIKFTKFC